MAWCWGVDPSLSLLHPLQTPSWKAPQTGILWITRTEFHPRTLRWKVECSVVIVTLELRGWRLEIPGDQCPASLAYLVNCRLLR